MKQTDLFTKLKKVIENRSLESLKEVWVVSFSDLINNEVDNFYKLDITKCNQ